MKKFDVDIERTVDAARLGWPEPGEAQEESGLGCNREYTDLRRFSWKNARKVLQSEENLMQEVAALSAEEPSDEFWDDLWEERGEYLCGLDLGVASTVAMLSAARCVPYTSCNGGCFEEGHHHESYPVVGFYARPPWIPTLVEAAEEAEAGMHNFGGPLVVYADDIWKMVAFARALSKRSSVFAGLKSRTSSSNSRRFRSSSPTIDNLSGQLTLRFEDPED